MPPSDSQAFIRELDKKLPALARWKTSQDSAKLPTRTGITMKKGKSTTGNITSTGQLIDDALEAVEREDPNRTNALNNIREGLGSQDHRAAFPRHPGCLPRDEGGLQCQPPLHVRMLRGLARSGNRPTGRWTIALGARHRAPQPTQTAGMEAHLCPEGHRTRLVAQCPRNPQPPRRQRPLPEQKRISHILGTLDHKSGAASYTYYAMGSLHPELGKLQAEGTVFGSINKKNFGNLKLVVPPDCLFLKFESVVRSIDTQIQNLEFESPTLATIRDNLLPKLLSGEVSTAAIPDLSHA